MPTSPPSRKVRLGPKALTELFRPSRLEVFESLQVAGPSSVAELARRLGRAPDSLYYHVRRLVEIGAVEELPADGPARNGPGRPAIRYAVAGRADAELDPRDESHREAYAAGGTAVLRLARRDFDRAIASGTARGRGARRNVLLRRVKVHLTPAQRKELNRRLDALHEFLVRHARDPEGELHVVTCVLSPLEDRSPR